MGKQNRRRLAMATAKLNKMANVWKGQCMDTKIRDLKSTVFPTATYGKAGHQLDKRLISAISDAYFDISWRGDISWYLDYDLYTPLQTGPADVGNNRDTYATCGRRGECLRFMPCPHPVASLRVTWSLH